MQLTHLLARGVAKEEDSWLIKWFLENKASDPSFGCFELKDHLVYGRKEDNVIVGIYKAAGATKGASNSDISGTSFD